MASASGRSARCTGCCLQVRPVLRAQAHELQAAWAPSHYEWPAVVTCPCRASVSPWFQSVHDGTCPTEFHPECPEALVAHGEGRCVPSPYDTRTVHRAQAGAREHRSVTLSPDPPHSAHHVPTALAELLFIFLKLLTWARSFCSTPVLDFSQNGSRAVPGLWCLASHSASCFRDPVLCSYVGVTFRGGVAPASFIRPSGWALGCSLLGCRAWSHCHRLCTASGWCPFSDVGRCQARSCRAV